jgi:hypothetical protein
MEPTLFLQFSCFSLFAFLTAWILSSHALAGSSGQPECEIIVVVGAPKEGTKSVLAKSIVDALLSRLTNNPLPAELGGIEDAPTAFMMSYFRTLKIYFEDISFESNILGQHFVSTFIAESDKIERLKGNAPRWLAKLFGNQDFPNSLHSQSLSERWELVEYLFRFAAIILSAPQIVPKEYQAYGYPWRWEATIESRSVASKLLSDPGMETFSESDQKFLRSALEFFTDAAAGSFQ